MGEHRKKEGLDMINSLKILGEILGYYVKIEYPMQAQEINPETIDIAWFKDDEYDFPIMIFEIESIIGGYVNNNPVKVYGKTIAEFEKPLFFFHIFMSGESDSRKIKNLENLFEKYNYKTYMVNNGKLTDLLLDIIDQHRRISTKFNLLELLMLIKNEYYIWNLANFDEILFKIEDRVHKDEKEILLPVYMKLFLYYDEFKNHIVRILKDRKNKAEILNIYDNYEYISDMSYFGSNWQIPIYLVLMCYESEGQESIEYFKLFKNWQDNNSYLSMIGPHFGLSRDYDKFIILYSGSFFLLMANLVSNIEGAQEYILSQVIKIFEKIKEFDGADFYYFATYALHISSMNSDTEEIYEYIRKYINLKGGCNKNILFEPYKIYEGDDIDENKIIVPEFNEFTQIMNNLAFIDDVQNDLNKVITELLINADIIMTDFYSSRYKY